MEHKEYMTFLRYIIIIILSIIASILVIVITTPKVKAFEFVYPDGSINVNSTTYYKYKLPDRVNNYTGNPNGGIFFGAYNYEYQTNYHSSFIDGHKYTMGQAYFDDSSLNDYLFSKNIDYLHNIWSEAIIPSSYTPNQIYNIDFGFHPAEQNSLDEVLSNGRYIDYNQYYTYSFDILVYNENGGLGEQVCSQITPTYRPCTGNSSGLVPANPNYSNIKLLGFYNDTPSVYDSSAIFPYMDVPGNVYMLYYDNKLQIMHVDIGFNATYMNKFAPNFSWVQQGSYRDYTFGGGLGYSMNNAVANHYPTDNVLHKQTKIYITNPYNLVLYSEQPSLYAQTEVWTQEDTDAILDSRFDGSQGFTDSFLSKLNSFIERDYGFAGMVNITFNFIKNILNVNYADSCFSVNIPILGKNIVLPCGHDFWSRNDMISFNTLYQFIWLGVVSYFIGWRVYKDILALLSPTSKIVQGNEVDSL